MPGILRAPKDKAWTTKYPIDKDWVRQELARVGTRCEVVDCFRRAVTFIELRSSIAYICMTHKNAIKRNQKAKAQLDWDMWDLLMQGHNVYYQALNLTPGVKSSRQWKKEAQADKKVAEQASRDARLDEAERKRQAKSENKIIREEVNIGVKPGMPDAQVAELRGYRVPENNVPLVMALL